MSSYFETSAQSSDTWSIWIRNPYPFEPHTDPDGYDETQSIVQTIKAVYEVDITYLPTNSYYHEIRVTNTLGLRGTPCGLVEWVAETIRCLHIYQIYRNDCRLMICRGTCEWTVTNLNSKPEWAIESDRLLQSTTNRSCGDVVVQHIELED